MKILVNELPKTSDECLFHFNSPATRNGCCKLAENGNSVKTCQLGSEGFKCPYLLKFEAEAFKYTYSGDAVTGYIQIPVKLKEN